MSKFVDLEAKLLADLKYGDVTERVLRYSKRFTQDYYWEAKVYQRDRTEQTIMESVIGRFCWYLFVANQTAYALNYREDPVLFADETPDKVRPNRVPLKELYEELRHIRYNLVTNDGNMFLAGEWEEILDDLISSMERTFIDQRKRASQSLEA